MSSWQYDDDADALTGARCLRPTSAAELLAEVVARAEAAAPHSNVVFDLDSTLLDNSPRQARILREYGGEVKSEILCAAQAGHWAGWDAAVAMRNAGLAEDEIERHREPFKTYWQERFFTSDYCEADEQVLGASRFVGAIARAGGHVCYVTGRHELMREGSVLSFARHGFPPPNDKDVHLLMKPLLEEDDDAYKARTYETLRSLGVVVAAFDNEPTHINGYRRAFPEALAVHLATDHSLRPVRIAAGVPSLRDFSAFH